METLINFFGLRQDNLNLIYPNRQKLEYKIKDSSNKEAKWIIILRVLINYVINKILHITNSWAR